MSRAGVFACLFALVCVITLIRDHFRGYERETMSAPYVSPLGDIVYDDMNDCVDEASFHVAVAPDLRLQMQARIMAAASLLKDRPVTKDKFYAAAWIAEDAHLQCLAWPIEYEVLYISVLRRCWAVVEASQKPMVVS